MRLKDYMAVFLISALISAGMNVLIQLLWEWC